MSRRLRPGRPVHGERRRARGAVDGDRNMRVAQRIRFDRPARSASARPLAPIRAGRSRRRAPAPVPATLAANCAGLAIASTSRQSTAFCPRTPSLVVQKTSARSWRTWRLSVSRVSPPVPGRTPSMGTSGRLTALLAVVDQKDLVAGERQLVAAAGAGAVDRGEELQPAVLRGILQAVARFVGELAEIDLPGVAGDARA